MFKLKKRIMSLGLALVLCMTMAMPVMAAPSRCPSCGSASIASVEDLTRAQTEYRPCIHGYASTDDRVEVLCRYRRYLWNSCHRVMVSDEAYSKEVMSRMCPWA